jgi:tetratricopeptide (TPR) repeat protein
MIYNHYSCYPAFEERQAARMIIRSIVIIFLVLQSAIAASRVSVVLFPLKNESVDELHEWIGYGFAETFSRKLQGMEGFQVWDPIFMYQTDSAGCDMVSDSLTRLHQIRWQWDVAIGGKYRASSDSIIADFKLVWATGREEPLKVQFKVAGKEPDFFSLCNEALQKAFSAIQYKVSSRDSETLRRGFSNDFSAYRTFAQGYGYEMHGNHNGALTAYARAEEIDPHFGMAACRQGILYRASNDFGQARAAFERAVASNGENPYYAAEYGDFLVECESPATAAKFIDAHRLQLGATADGMKAMGKLYVATGQFQRALALLTKAVAYGPSSLDVEFSLGTAYLAGGDFVRAADIFNHLIQYRPAYVRFYASLGGTYRKAGRLMESTQILESAQKIAPDNTMILIDLAHTYITLGWYEKAAQLLLRAHEISPLLGDITVNMGVVYWYQGKRDEAVRCFNDAAQKATTRQSALNNLGTVLFWGGSIGKAIEAYKKADEAGGKNETILYNIAMAYLKEGKPKKAARYFDEMLALTPDRIDVLLQQSAIALSYKRYGDAEGYFHKIIELLPDHEGAIRGLVEILLRQGRYKEALQPVEDFLERQPINHEFMLQLARIYHKMGWYEVALMKYQAVTKEFPNDSSGYLGAGECMYYLIKEKGDRNYDNAIMALKQAADHSPRNPEPEMLIGDIYADYKGYKELAVDHWRKALAKATDRPTQRQLERKLAGK